MSWLTEKQLIHCIKRNADADTLQAFHGVFTIDKLPQAVQHYPCLLIINTQAHNTPGEHWIAAFVGENRRGEVFDSLAMPTPTLLLRWMNTYACSFRRNSLQYQHPLSARCGAYVLFYVLNRLKKPQCIHENFSASLHNNEQYVSEFYRMLKK